MTIRQYFGGIIIAIDQLFNSLIGGFADETASSRAGRERAQGDLVGRIACGILDAIEKDHCAISIEETAEGETDPHHLGRVIRELPPDHPRLHKVQP